MIEHTVKGIISTLYENFDKKHIKGNELKNSMNALCECVSNKEDIKTVVKNKLEVVAETYNHFGNKVCPENYCEMMNIVCEGFNDSLSDFVKRIKVKCGIQENTTVLKESELNRMLVEAVAKNIKKLTEGRNDEPSNTHYAVHKPTNTIVFSWDYSGYDSDELKQFKKDYFISDLIDMGMDPKEVTILTRKACERKGINPTDDSCWSNYPMTECNSMKSINEEQTSEPTYNTMQEAMDDYENIGNDMSTPNFINGYVVMDGTGAVRGQFSTDEYQDAVNYANELAVNAKLRASFDVYGVDEDGYGVDVDNSTLVYSTYDNEDELLSQMFSNK